MPGRNPGPEALKKISVFYIQCLTNCEKSKDALIQKINYFVFSYAAFWFTKF